MKVVPVPKNAMRSVKILHHFKKMTVEDGFHKVELAPADTSIEILDGSFSEIRPIGSKTTRDPRIARGSFSKIQACSTPKQGSSTENNATPPLLCDNFENISVISDAEEEKTPLQRDREKADLSYNSEENSEQGDKALEIFIQEAQEFVRRSGQVLLQQQKRKDRLLKQLDRYRRKTTRITRALEELEEIINVTRRCSSIFSE